MTGAPVPFADRRDAGRKLADALRGHAALHPVVLALPRGGVPVAYEVAEALAAPLDLIFVRKIGAPGHPELGVGAVVDGSDPRIVVNPVAAQLGISRAYIDAQAARELEEIERRRLAYVGGRNPYPVRGRTVIVIDDGIATGGTARAALQGLAEAGARRTILAVPVAAVDTVEELRSDADEIVTLATPDPFYAVGLYYGDFTQTDDAEVVALMKKARSWTTEDAGSS
jgi:putative phosphoribosyl transferase